MKIMTCLTHIPDTDQDRWIYPWKEYCGVASYLHSEYQDHIEKHRIPSFLSLQAHLSIEHILEALVNIFFRQFPFKTVLLPYDILHGIVSSYNMRDILEFWNGRT